jgi:signal transduction histidine kinase
VFVIKNAFRVAIHNPSSLVFVAVVASSFVMAYARAKPPLTGSELLSLVVLGMIYSIVGTLFFWAVIATGSVKYKILYLFIQFILGMLIMHLARGNGWLVMLPIVSHSFVLFSPREALIPCVLILAGMSWSSSQVMGGWMTFLQWTVVLGSIVLFTAIFTNLAMREARAKEDAVRLAAQLEQANRDLQAYAAKAEEMAAIQERNRLAREIHDGLGHYLTAMNMQSKVAAALIEENPFQAKDAVSKLQEMILAALEDVRQSVAALRTDGMTGKHLPEVLEPLVTKSRRAGLATELTIHGEPRPLSPALELALYRAIQEGLTNTQKHARASQVTIRLEYRSRDIFLSVQDNGQGAKISMDNLQEAPGSYGLFGLRERVQLLGGEMRIETEPGAGFRVEIILPESLEGQNDTHPHPDRR